MKHYFILVLAICVISAFYSCDKDDSEIDPCPSSDYYVLDITNGEPRPGLTLLKVESFQQTTEYTCGPAAVVSLLGFYGRSGNELNIAQEMGTSNTVGTNPEQMATWLSNNGFDASWHEYGELDTLTNRLKRNIPTLVEWNDWGGHWVLVIGYDNRQTEDLMDDVIIFADPYDRHDDHQDGYTWFNAVRFYYMWYDALLFGDVMKRIYITATPKSSD